MTSLPALTNGGAKGGRDCALVLDDLHHRRFAAFAARNVDVIGASLLEREPDEFAAALNRRPVIKQIAHGSPPAAREVSRQSARGHVRVAAHVPVQ